MWHIQFLDGRESLEGEEHAGKPISVRTPEMIKKVFDFIAYDRIASLKMMGKSLNINRWKIPIILHEHLSKTKICSKFVPHTLTDKLKSMIVNHLRDVFATSRNDSNFLKSIVTGDET